MGMVKHCQNSQNSRFAMSLQYLSKEVRDEVDNFGGKQTSTFPTSWFQHFGYQRFPQGVRHNHENVKDIVTGMIKHSQSTLQCL